MIINKAYEENQFKFLPFLKQCNEKKWKEKIISSTEYIILNEFQNEILQLVLSKENWTKSRYINFKTNIAKIKSKDVIYCVSTIHKILLMEDNEIIEELHKFTNLEQDFYPFIERKKEEESGKYVILTKDISVDDSFAVVSEITKKIRSYASTLSHKFLLEQDNPYASIDLMIEMLDGKDIENKNRLLNDFDTHFSYLKESVLSKDIYYRYREDFLNIVLNAFAFHVSNYRTCTTENIDAYLYIKKKRTEKE